MIKWDNCQNNLYGSG